MRRTKRMSERSNWEIVWVFLVFSPLCAVVLLVISLQMILTSGVPNTAADWFGLVWCVVVLPLSAIVLPAVGWQELQTRRAKSAEPKAPQP